MSASALHADEAILETLIENLKQLTGQDEVEATTCLPQLLEEWDSSLAHIEFTIALEDWFSVDLSLQDVWSFFAPDGDAKMTREVWLRDVWPNLTVEKFAIWLEQRLQPVVFEPISLLGSPPCRAAGYFVGIRTLVERLRPAPIRFGPSTPILSVLSRSQIQRLWRRLEQTLDLPLPPLRVWLDHLATSVLVGSVACFALGVVLQGALLASTSALFLKTFLLGLSLRQKACPLPCGLETFGDLSRYLARVIPGES